MALNLGDHQIQDSRPCDSIFIITTAMTMTISTTAVLVAMTTATARAVCYCPVFHKSALSFCMVPIVAVVIQLGCCHSY